MYINTNLHSRNYASKDVVRILNIEQEIFYNENGVYPIDLYPSYDERMDRKVIVFIFSKKDTSEVYKKWIVYKNSLAQEEENHEQN